MKDLMCQNFSKVQVPWANLGLPSLILQSTFTECLLRAEHSSYWKYGSCPHGAHAVVEEESK